jgi:predicted  nucleic acid-binding Zn-ribbon protein
MDQNTQHELNALQFAWQVAEERVTNLKDAIEDLDAPPDPDELPEKRERLAELKQQAREAKEQFLAAGGKPEGAEGSTPNQDNAKEAEELRRRVDKILHGEHKHVKTPWALNH